MIFFFFYKILSFYPDDPMFANQFYLKNDGQFGGLPGEDINIIPAWEKNYTGKDISILMYGTGCRTTHKEFEGRINESICWNYGTNSSDPFDPEYIQPDATQVVAGLAVSSSNGFCGVGVAPEATLGCVNFVWIVKEEIF